MLTSEETKTAETIARLLELEKVEIKAGDPLTYIEGVLECHRELGLGLPEFSVFTVLNARAQIEALETRSL